jgi:probable phosphoglycerate mutase
VIAHWLRLPTTVLDYASFRVEAGSISHLREDDYFHNRTLVLLNDTTHLQTV